jgi:glycosyltransferase involved in cell wall biosynthesis
MNDRPIKLIDVELSQPIESYTNLHAYAALQALVRLHGVPIGSVRLPLYAGACAAAELSQAIVGQLDRAILRHLVDDGLAAARPNGLRLADLLETPHPAYTGPFPFVTVAVCTRDRTNDLATCLAALRQIDYPAFEVLVVDNAPASDATERLVRTRHPEVCYTREVRPGLDWARNRAILGARGEIIAYTDDDVVVDPGWLRALVPLFTQNPEVMAVTGLVVPFELETPAQLLFERYGGFGRGYARKWYRLQPTGSRRERHHIGVGALGTGANMAYRRSIFAQIGLFDPALDVGTPTNGGGDLEMFFRVLVEGHTLVYEPAALVRHRHRRDYALLRTQLANNGIGFYAFLSRSVRAYPRERRAIVGLGLWWLWRWNLRRLLISYLHPAHFPRDLILAELRGSLAGLVRYRQARRVQLRIERQLGAQ